MGIYLPKVDMPQGDETLTIQICPDGSIWQRFRGTVPGAKAVPVHPHGRLIDADAQYEKFARLESEAMNALKTTNTGSVNWIKWSAILTERTGYKHDIADAPTIIPAEE